MQTSNISNQSAFTRFALGTTMTAMGIAKYSRNPECYRARGMIILGAMKMAEGVFKYCPTKALMQNSMQSSVQNVFTTENPDMTKIMQDFAQIVSSGNSATQGGNGNSSSGGNMATNTGNNAVANTVNTIANAVGATSGASNLASNLANNGSNANASSKGSSAQGSSTNKTVTSSTNKSSQTSTQKNQTATATNPS